MSNKFTIESQELKPKEVQGILRSVFAAKGHPQPICLCGKPGCVAGDTKIYGHWEGNVYKGARTTIEHIYKHQHDIK